VLETGFFCAFVATGVSATFVVALSLLRGGGLRDVPAALAALPVVAIYAAIPAASFGFVCGILGGFWLLSRNGRFGSRARMYTESILFGAFLSLWFPMLHAAISKTGDGWFDLAECLFSASVGCATAILCASAYGSPVSRNAAAEKDNS